MQALIRETLSRYLLEVPELVDLHKAGDPVFVEKTGLWLSSLERDLGRLRETSASFAAAKRSQLLAAKDSPIPIGVKGASRRKLVRTTASAVIGEVTDELRARLREIDTFLADMTEKMAQLLAVKAAEDAIEPQGDKERTLWLESVWSSFRNGNGAGMYGYLSARLHRADRLYLLDQMTSNMVVHLPESAKKVKRGKKKSKKSGPDV